ncbi:MAG: DUF349 domain-containing protein [Paludibacteraceae bacterium]|nr:DUF349 domain-containing protein [Paludibacteraceae bacterium]
MSETKQQLIEDLKALLNEDATEIKEQVEHLKTQFYRGTSDEEAENAEENAALEQQFKELLSQYKAKRAEAAAKNAAEQSANMARKQQILDEMKTLAEGETDSVMSNLQRMRELQAEWKNIGAVPADKQSEMRKAYQQYQEQFYDMVKINIELRDLDFKKNLELKTLLCEAAERLINSDNIVEANRALQQLHDEWAEIGPVARELREDLWNRFKTASTAINKKHQDYFDQLHAKEQENFERKQAIIAELQQLNAGLPQEEGKPVSFRWDDATEKVQALQNEWRTIGFAPKKHNQAVYDQYRAECDRFFHAKTAYFKNVRDTMSENLAHKRSLVERAEQLAEQAQANTENDWLKEAADVMRALQDEWKTVGPVARKYSDELWKRFSAAADRFFETKRDAARKAKATVRAKATAKEGVSLYRLRDNLQQEIKTAENNILFFTAKSKTANKLVDDMQRKINDLKKRLDEVKAQIKEQENE